jgi:hypothetical protein
MFYATLLCVDTSVLLYHLKDHALYITHM